jgi:hypothetical protein
VVLNASEIAEYTYCPEAWYLRRHAVSRSPDAERRLQHGAARHREIGHTTDRIRLVSSVRMTLLIAMGLVSLALVIQLAGLPAR